MHVLKSSKKFLILVIKKILKEEKHYGFNVS